ncbi:MAG: U32 family peptidase [Desulforhopalus sp.]
MLHRKIELLAPAKNCTCGISAINHGADAVYIGGPQFGARAAAGNSLADIEKLVAHGHQFKARVYVAINTIFNDHELDSAVHLCQQLYNIGVDALIIQDVGLLESELPPIPLHSSTQMNNRTVDKVRFLEKVGFRQVVLARELSLSQIKEIRAATSVPLEFFVHGALCVSYSGQCYISEVVAGRSANRGECAQFCRHNFTLKDGDGNILKKDRYLLSLRDLDLSGHLRELIDAGISSFKIEGRLKDENYVKNITAYYRQALDGLIERDSELQRSSSGSCNFDFTPDPSRSFNRGRTDYFLTDSKGHPGAIESPKSKGQMLGKVVHTEKRYFVLDTKEIINNGDGLCYFDPGRGLVGMRVNRTEGEKIYPKDPQVLPVGVVMYRNGDIAFNKILARSEQCRSIAVQLDLKETADGLCMMVLDEDGIQSETGIKLEKEVARQIGTNGALAEKQLRKSGGTVFSVRSIAVDLSPELFVSAAICNELRRKALAGHLEQRLRHYRNEYAEVMPNDVPWPADEVSYLDNIANHQAETFYRRHGVQTINRQALCAAEVAECALMTSKYCIRAQLDICPQTNKKSEDVVLPLILSDYAEVYELGFDCKRCEMILRKQQTKE